MILLDINFYKTARLPKGYAEFATKPALIFPLLLFHHCMGT